MVGFDFALSIFMWNRGRGMKLTRVKSEQGE